MPTTRFAAAFAALLLTGLAGAEASAQAVTIDEGTFRILSGGREIGTETFTIRRSGTDDAAVTVAQGRVTMSGGQPIELSTTLEISGPALRPAAYQLDLRGPDAQRISGRVVGGRFTARIRSAAGEMMREYVAGEGAVVLEDGVAHHHHFLVEQAGDAPFRVPVLVPRQNRQVSAQVTIQGREGIEVGGRTVQARRLTLEVAGIGPRQVWADDAGRVLRVEIPDRNYVAVRSNVP